MEQAERETSTDPAMERRPRPAVDEDVRLIISLLRSLRRRHPAKYREAVIDVVSGSVNIGGVKKMVDNVKTNT